jgi:hypothetical protein
LVVNPLGTPGGVVAEGSFKTFAQFDLPAGNFIVSATVIVANNDPALPANVSCNIPPAFGGGTLAIGADQTTTLAFTVPVTLSAGGPITLSCGEFTRSLPNQNVFVARVVMNAIQVGTLTQR